MKLFINLSKFIQIYLIFQKFRIRDSSRDSGGFPRPGLSVHITRHEGACASNPQFLKHPRECAHPPPAHPADAIDETIHLVAPVKRLRKM